MLIASCLPPLIVYIAFSQNFTSDTHELEKRCMDKAVYEDIPESTGYKNIFTTKTADEIQLTANAAYLTVRTGNTTCGDYYEN